MPKVKPCVDGNTKQPNGNFYFIDPATGKTVELATTKAWNPHQILHKFNGDVENPTFDTAVRIVNGKDFGTAFVNEYVYSINHFVVQDGHIRYFDDCTHIMKGKTVVLPEMK